MFLYFSVGNIPGLIFISIDSIVIGCFLFGSIICCIYYYCPCLKYCKKFINALKNKEQEREWRNFIEREQNLSDERTPLL